MSSKIEVALTSEVLAKMLNISVSDVEKYVTVETNQNEESQMFSHVANFDISTPEEVLQAAGAAGSYFVELSLSPIDEDA